MDVLLFVIWMLPIAIALAVGRYIGRQDVMRILERQRRVWEDLMDEMDEEKMDG